MYLVRLTAHLCAFIFLGMSFTAIAQADGSASCEAISFFSCVIENSGNVEICQNELDLETSSIDKTKHFVNCFEQRCEKDSLFLTYCAEISKTYLDSRYTQQSVEEILNSTSDDPEYNELNVLLQWLINNEKDIKSFRHIFKARVERWNRILILEFNKIRFYDEAAFFSYHKTHLDSLSAHVLAENGSHLFLDLLLTRRDLDSLKLIGHYLDEGKVNTYLKHLIFSGVEIPNDLILPFLDKSDSKVIKGLVDLVAADGVHKNNIDSLKDKLIEVCSTQDIPKLVVLFDRVSFHNYLNKFTSKLSSDDIVLLLGILDRRSSTLFSDALQVLSEQKRITDLLDSFEKLALSDESMHQVLTFLLHHLESFDRNALRKYLNTISISISDDQLAETYILLMQKVVPESEQLLDLLNKFVEDGNEVYLSRLINNGDLKVLQRVFENCEKKSISIWKHLTDLSDQRSVAIKPFLKYVVQKHLGDTKVLGKFHDQALKHLSLHDHIYLLSLTGNKLARESLSIVLNNQMSASYSVELLGNYRDVIRGLEVRRRLVIRLDRLIAQKEALLANTLEELLGVSDNSGVAYTWSMLRKLKGVVLSLDKNNMRDISAVFSNIERVLSTQYNIEHQTLLRQFEEFISLAKLAVKGGYAIPEREMTLLSFVGQVYSKKTDSIYFSYLENMLSDRSYSQYTFSGLLMESLTLKYLLAVSPHKKLKELSRDQISLITTLISDLQERLVQNIFAETEFDQIENIYLDSISEYHATISDVPIWGTLSCEQASSCYFDLRYSNNIGPITTVESGPLLYEGKLNYPVSALGVRQNAVREGAFRFYDQSALTISAIPSDILIVDVSIKEEEAPQKPLKGYHGRPRITEVLQKRVKYCKGWAKIGKWCLDHDYKQVNYAHEVQSMQNGFSGRDGVSGANSSDIHFDFSRSMTGSEFSKIIVFNSSGDGGEGADGGSRGGGSMPGSFGAGGDPGRIGTIDVISNPRQIPIIQIGKVGLKGKDGVTGN